MQAVTIGRLESLDGTVTLRAYDPRWAVRAPRCRPGRAGAAARACRFHGGLGLWWGNGAALQHVHEILDLADAPAHVAGVASIGQAVAVPWNEIHVYVSSISRDAEEFGGVDSTVDNHLAQRVLERFESSSGIRPTLLRARGRESPILLRRDGRRRVFPFNLLFDADPRALAGPRPPSPVQDVQILE